MKTDWSARDIPDLAGKTAIVTGGNSGIGFFTALELGRAGADVVVACRDRTRGTEAVAAMCKQAPSARLALEELDLASLASVRAFAGRFGAAHPRLDILVNNAGIMAIPERRLTADGFESQIGTNHFGHFALTGLLLDRLLASPGARVVTVSSLVADWARLDLDDLQSQRRYVPMRAYGRSKLANLLFAAELDRRAAARGLVSAAAHPGSTITNLQKHAYRRLTRVFGQTADQGALPSLYAATAPGVPGGSYWGPRALFRTRGAPGPASPPRRARDPETARALWEASEKLTGVTFG